MSECPPFSVKSVHHDTCFCLGGDRFSQTSRASFVNGLQVSTPRPASPSISSSSGFWWHPGLIICFSSLYGLRDQTLGSCRVQTRSESLRSEPRRKRAVLRLLLVARSHTFVPHCAWSPPAQENVTASRADPTHLSESSWQDTSCNIENTVSVVDKLSEGSLSLK